MSRRDDDRAWRDTWGEDMDRGVSERSHAMLGLLVALLLAGLLAWAAVGGGLG